MVNTLAHNNVNNNKPTACSMTNNFTNELNQGGMFQENNYNLDDMYASY